MDVKAIPYDDARLDWEDLEMFYYGRGVYGRHGGDFRSFLDHLGTQADKRLIPYFRARGDLATAGRLEELAGLAGDARSLSADEIERAHQRYREVEPTLRAHFPDPYQPSAGVLVMALRYLEKVLGGGK